MKTFIEYTLSNPSTPRKRYDPRKENPNFVKRVNKAVEEKIKKGIKVEDAVCLVNSCVANAKNFFHVEERIQSIKSFKIEEYIFQINNNVIVAPLGFPWENRKLSNQLYNKIQDIFNLYRNCNIVWVNFEASQEDEKRIVVVGKGAHINQSYETTAGKICTKLNIERNNTSQVLIIPILRDYLQHISCSRFECAIGNYLSEHDAPIIDYYSHCY